MQKSFAGYTLQGGSDGKSKFKFHDHSLYHWTVLISGRNDGALYIWLHDGRPEVVGCVVTRPAKRVLYHEFHSLSAHPITATLEGQSNWHPESAGLQMEVVPHAPPPAATSLRRRSQMRNLAKDFAVTVVHQKDESRWETRMLTRPVYEYSPEGGEVLEGGLFLFVREGDPQLLLVLEARRGESSDAWKYGLARLSSNEIAIQHDREPIRTIARWPWRFDPTDDRPRDEPYAQFMMGIYPRSVAAGNSEPTSDNR
jgi:hypothetical protein